MAALVALIAGCASPPATTTTATPLAGAASGTPATQGTAAPTITMKIGNATAPDYYHNVALLVFKQEAERLTGGQLKVNLFPSAQLGDEVQLTAAIRAGTVEGYVGSVGSMSTSVPGFGILELPYLFTGYDHVYRVLDKSDLGQRLRAEAAKVNIEVLNFWPAGRRDMYGNVRIVKPADLAGVKIRTQASGVLADFFKLFGAIPTAIAYSELYGALQQRVVDEGETALTAAYTAKHNEVSKFVSLSNHSLTVAGLVVSKKWFDALPANVQQAIRSAEVTARAKALELDKQSFDDAVAKFRASGVTILEVDIAAFKSEVTTKLYPKFAEKFGAKDIEFIQKN